MTTFAEALAEAKRLSAAGEWDAAFAAWDVLTKALEAVDLPGETVALLLSYAGNARLEYAWAHEAEVDDLGQAIGLYQRAIQAAPDDDSDLYSYWNSLGRAALTLHERVGDRGQLDLAIAALRASVDARPIADVQRTLGNALYRGGFLDEAIDNLQAALELDEDAATGSDLGSALLGRFDARGKPEDLDDAVAALERVITTAASPSAQMLANLGNALSARAEARSSREDAAEAVRRLRQALASCDHERRPAMRSNLAAALMDSYSLTGAIADVDEAVALLEEAVAGTPPGTGERAPRLNNLGIALRLRQLKRRDGRRDLDRAVRALLEALDLNDDVAYHVTLGNVLNQLYDESHDMCDLKRAIDEFELAVTRTPQESPDRPSYLNNLSAALSARAERDDNMDDLQQAATHLDEAVRLRDERSVHLPGLLVNVGNARSELAKKRGRPEDAAAARSAYRGAAVEGLDMNPGDALGAACNWSEWATARGAWAEVAEAYRHGVRAASALLHVQSLRKDKEAWLRDAQTLTGNGAFALAVSSDLEEAVLALESGRALLVSDRLERDRGNLLRLGALGARYEVAASHLGDLESRELGGGGDRHPHRRPSDSG